MRTAKKRTGAEGELTDEELRELAIEAKFFGGSFTSEAERIAAETALAEWRSKLDREYRERLALLEAQRPTGRVPRQA